MILLDVQNVEKQENNKNTIINNLYYSNIIVILYNFNIISKREFDFISNSLFFV